MFVGPLVAIVAQAEVVDRVAAVVADELILASDVSLEADLGRLDPSPWTARQPDPLARLVDGAILRALGGDVRLYQPSAREVDDRVDAFRRRLGDRAWSLLLTRHGIGADVVANALRRHLIRERYLRRNLTIPPEDPNWAARVSATVDLAREGLRVRIVAEEDR
jgi:hypothetical protein